MKELSKSKMNGVFADDRILTEADLPDILFVVKERATVKYLQKIIQKIPMKLTERCIFFQSAEKAIELIE